MFMSFEKKYFYYFCLSIISFLEMKVDFEENIANVFRNGLCKIKLQNHAMIQLLKVIIIIFFLKGVLCVFFLYIFF